MSSRALKLKMILTILVFKMRMMMRSKVKHRTMITILKVMMTFKGHLMDFWNEFVQILQNIGVSSDLDILINHYAKTSYS